MKVGDVRDLLMRLKNIQTKLGAKGPAKDLENIVNLFDGHEHKDIEQFVEDTRQELDAKVSKRSGRKIELNEVIVRQFLAQLNSENHANGKFDSVFEALKTCKDVRKVEAVAIAQKFLNTTSSFKSKSAALKDIYSSYLLDRQAESKAEIIRKMAI